MKPLVATRNLKKLVELDRILRAAGIDSAELLSLSDVPEYPKHPETGRIFVNNAYIKAFDGATYTGCACLADDSGFSVDELNGMSGVLSARWSDTHSDDVADYELLLAQMGDRPDERRMVSLRTACVLVIPGVKEVSSALIDGGSPAAPDEAGNLLLVVESRWSGLILCEPVRDNGFGHDPVFAPTVGEGNETEGALFAA